MIALGGVIGAGLFVGSGVVIKSAGPAAVLSFVITGLLVVLVMRMLGEMAVALPAVGSFYEYARLAFSDRPPLGDLAGFLTGWMYWYFWVIVVALEAVAGAGLVRFWLPGAPAWLISLALLVALTLTNLFSVKGYGEFEFWFASIKVAAIAVFLLVGGLFVLGLWPGGVAHWSALTAHGGFAPNGMLPILTGAVAATGFYFGAEIVTIAAAEAAEPAKAVAEATKSVISRALLFLCGLDSPGRLPRALEFARHRHPLCERSRGDGHSRRGPDHERGGAHGGAVGAEFGPVRLVAHAVRADPARRCAACASPSSAATACPRRAILLGTLFGYAAVVMSYVSPDTVFAFLVNSYGTVAIFVYVLIAVSQLRLRARLEREEPERLAGAHVGVSVPHLLRDLRDARHRAGDGLHPRAAHAARLWPLECGDFAAGVPAAPPPWRREPAAMSEARAAHAARA